MQQNTSLKSQRMLGAEPDNRAEMKRFQCSGNKERLTVMWASCAPTKNHITSSTERVKAGLKRGSVLWDALRLNRLVLQTQFSRLVNGRSVQSILWFDSCTPFRCKTTPGRYNQPTNKQTSKPPGQQISMYDILAAHRWSAWVCQQWIKVWYTGSQPAEGKGNKAGQTEAGFNQKTGSKTRGS